MGRFDLNHPDTKGMSQYFVRRLGGMRREIGREDTARFRAKPEMRFRRQPAAVVTGGRHRGNPCNGHHRYRDLSMWPVDQQEFVLRAHSDLYHRRPEGFVAVNDPGIAHPKCPITRVPNPCRI